MGARGVLLPSDLSHELIEAFLKDCERRDRVNDGRYERFGVDKDNCSLLAEESSNCDVDSSVRLSENDGKLSMTPRSFDADGLGLMLVNNRP